MAGAHSPARSGGGVPYAYVGAGDGVIRVFALDRGTGALALIQEVEGGPGPSFLAFSPDRRAVVGVNEGSDQLAAFSIDPRSGRLTPLNRVPSNGAWPVHVAVDATGRYVLGASYFGGAVTMISLLPDHSLGEEVATLSTGAHAHQAAIDPANRFVFVPNQGAGTISQLVLDAAHGTLVFNDVPSVSLPAGSGPRHMVFHPSAPFAYVIREDDDRVTAFPYDPRTGALGAPLQSISTLPDGVSGERNTGAEIAFGACGRYLHASNRGHDSIVTYSVDPCTGTMTLLGHTPSGGKKPRHFSVEPLGEVLLVANQGSGDVVTFRVSPLTGALSLLSTTALPAGPAFVEVVYLCP